jgi:calcineurin-like phosphoesterase family protein
MRKQKMTRKEMEITMNMWGMAPATIKKIVKKIEEGYSHTFKNGMVYNPTTEIIVGK